MRYKKVSGTTFAMLSNVGKPFPCHEINSLKMANFSIIASGFV